MAVLRNSRTSPNTFFPRTFFCLPVRCTRPASGPDPGASARKAFAELEAQIKKHKARLRKDHEWNRKRGKAEQALA